MATTIIQIINGQYGVLGLGSDGCLYDYSESTGSWVQRKGTYDGSELVKSEDVKIVDTDV